MVLVGLSQVVALIIVPVLVDMYLFSLISFKESEFANKDTGFKLLNLNVVSRTWFNT